MVTSAFPMLNRSSSPCGLPWQVAAVCVLLSCPRPAAAQPSEPSEGPPEAKTPPPPAASQPRRDERPLPDYDGRPEEPATFGDGALWVPRVLAFPLYLVSECLVRQPMKWLVVRAERQDWPTKIMDFFTFGEERQAGLIPTAFFDFGFKPSVGLYFFADDVAVPDNAIRANVGFWGLDWLKIAARDRISLDEETTVEVGGSWIRRPDFVFHGIGPRSLDDDASRYASDRAEGFLLYDVGLWRWSSIQALTGIRDVNFREASCCDDPSLQNRAGQGAFVVPSAFDRGYTAGFARLDGALDSRRPEPYPGHGVRIEAFGEQGVELDPDRPPNRWVKYGGKLGGFVDLTGTRRVLSLWVSSELADPLGGEETVPFTELVIPGGSRELRGYREGRLHGRSMFVSTLQYEWPVWVWLRGTIQVAAGNVFGEHLEGFDPELIRLSSTIGFRSTGSQDHYLEVLTGVGTETYEQGWDVTSFRLMLGGNSGF